MTELSRTFRRFAEDVGGAIDAVEFVWGGDTGGRVWQLTFRGGDVAYLKAPRGIPKAQREIAAYGEWVAAVEMADRTPRLIASRLGAEPGLLMTAVPGLPMHEAALSGDEEREAYRQAGQFLRALHRVPYEDSDPLSIEDAVQRRIEAWRKRAASALGDERLRAFDRRLAGPVITGPRVPCHRDYRPRNWIVERRPSNGLRLRVVDFEHARPDVWLADLARLSTGDWRKNPSRREAFLAGYGHELSAQEDAQLRRLAALDELGAIAWEAGRR